MRKKALLKTGSLLMALLVLFASVGWTISSHYCTVTHIVTHSFRDASEQCEHCLGHHHNHMTAAEFESHLKVTHFGTKCCCGDYNSKIQLTDSYLFSLLRNLVPDLYSDITPHIELYDADLEWHEGVKPTLWIFPILRSGPEKVIFYSKLKLNPFIS